MLNQSRLFQRMELPDDGVTSNTTKQIMKDPVGNQDRLFLFGLPFPLSSLRDSRLPLLPPVVKSHTFPTLVSCGDR